jgi:hypothetical protein
MENWNLCINEQRTKNMNQIDIKKWCPSYCFGLLIISTVFSLWSRWILFLLWVFLLYVWGDVVSSRCCCRVAWRYNGIPYVDSCLVPARQWSVLVVPARPGFPEMIYKSAMKKRAGQPALASSSAPWPRTGLPKSPKWSPHPPLAQSAASDLESEAEVWFLRGRPLLHLCRGRGRYQEGEEGVLSPGWSEGGEGSPLVLPVTWFWEEVKRCR